MMCEATCTLGRLAPMMMMVVVNDDDDDGDDECCDGGDDDDARDDHDDNDDDADDVHTQLGMHPRTKEDNQGQERYLRTSNDDVAWVGTTSKKKGRQAPINKDKQP